MLLVHYVELFIPCILHFREHSWLKNTHYDIEKRDETLTIVL